MERQRVDEEAVIRAAMEKKSGIKYGEMYSHDFFGERFKVCKSQLEKYGSGDEEKRLCGISTIGDISNDCVVYSIGSNNQWQFERDIVTKTKCKVETFDCMISLEAKVPDEIAHRVTLHRVCIFDRVARSGNQTFLSWPSLLSYMKAKVPPTVLKLDVEGYEWSVLKSMILPSIKDPELTAKKLEMLPNQIAIEMHMHKHRTQDEILTFLSFLQLFGGYILADLRENTLCQHCAELLFIRISCEGKAALKIGSHGAASSQSQSQSHMSIMKAMEKHFSYVVK
eukprot:CAMPEP_0182417678 /NCGR_PEP_ID=MMETSP1167-20130531/2115_1 /TAXON_ID=2988 /ORGANISM="Mallomonas Sp, Strain CCMP3275" /LENGTH=281 /DNA_ID=CAMNT_0024591389 /DNA_START=244 /DNA_END=1089 /DNA_ORIENTATION=+